MPYKIIPVRKARWGGGMDSTRQVGGGVWFIPGGNWNPETWVVGGRSMSLPWALIPKSNSSLGAKRLQMNYSCKVPWRRQPHPRLSLSVFPFAFPLSLEAAPKTHNSLARTVSVRTKKKDGMALFRIQFVPHFQRGKCLKHCRNIL